MKLYRYFSPTGDIFAGLFDLKLTSLSDLETYKELLPRNYNQRYFSKRLKTEQMLFDLFKAKGGVLQRNHPYYLTLGPCDEWFFGRKHCYGSLAFDLSEFDTNTISFTYGDSIPTFMEQHYDGKEYRRNVYTMKEIEDLIQKYGFPQEWNPLGQKGPENYIEAQVWSEHPILEYRPCGYPEGEGISTVVPRIATRMLITKGLSPNGQIGFEDCIRKAKDHPWWKWFAAYVRQAKAEAFQQNAIHGILHGYKCALFAFVYALEWKLSEKDARTLVLASLYHDVGRTQFDGIRSHGQIGADIITQYIPADHGIWWDQLKNSIRFHDSPETPFDSWYLRVLRDMDTLDYLRLGFGDFDHRFLHTETAKKMIQFSIELNIYCYFDPNWILKLVSEE